MDSPRPDDETRDHSSPDLLAFERICDEFEDALRAGSAVDAAVLVTRFSQADRPELLRELLLLELAYRPSEDHPTIHRDYLARLPEYSGLIDDVFHARAGRTADPAWVTRIRPSGSAPEAERVLPLPTVPGYEIEAELGRGAMGVVYRARHLGLNRIVALKTTFGSAGEDAKQLIRFLAEAESAAAIDHPNVARVYDFGEFGHRPFIAMEYCPGGTLSQKLSKGSLPAGEAAALVEKIARGVAAAHDLNIVHRDLKPANVLLDASSNPKVSDFGIAKRLSNDLTRTQALMGTPAYMAPEQAAGRAKFVGPPADVWALGVMLYEAIAGQRPFDGETSQVLLSRIQSVEPSSLRTRVWGVPRDLETIVSKCLSKEPELRYSTATELADDLARFLRGEPIVARPVGVVERTIRWARRKPTAAAAYTLSVVVAVLAVFTALVVSLWIEAKGARGTAESERDRAETARSQAESAEQAESRARKAAVEARERIAAIDYGRTVQVAYQEWQDQNAPGARVILEDTRPEFRDWEYRHVHRICNGQLFTFATHTAQVLHGSWSPDGTRIVTGSGDGTARIWDAATGREIFKYEKHGNWVWSAFWSADGTHILTCGHDRTVRVWKAATGKDVHVLKDVSAPVRWAAWSPDGTRIAAVDQGSTAHIWDARSGKKLHTMAGHAGWVIKGGWSPDGKRLVTVTFHDGVARVWNAENGKEEFSISEGVRHLHAAAFSPDGTRLYLGTRRFIRVVDARTGLELSRLTGHIGPTYHFAFSRDGTRMVSASTDNTARVWDVRRGTELFALKGHTDMLWAAEFSPDGSEILTASEDKTARRWDARNGVQGRVWMAHREGIYNVAWDVGGTRVLTSSNDNSAQVWDARTGALQTSLQGHKNWVNWAAWSADGARIATASADKSVRVWDSDTGAELFALNGHTSYVNAVAWNRDGLRLATASGDGTARIWDLATRKDIRTFKNPGGTFTRVAWSPDQKHVAVGGNNGTVYVWDVVTGDERTCSRGHGDQYLSSVMWSADGTEILSADVGGVARIWDARTGVVRLVLKDESGKVLQAAWNASETRIVTASGGGVARIWDAKSGLEVLALRGHRGWVQAAQWSPDGTRLATACSDGTVRVLESGPFEALPTGLERAPYPRERPLR